jgi:hypothetical protein
VLRHRHDAFFVAKNHPSDDFSFCSLTERVICRRTPLQVLMDFMEFAGISQDGISYVFQLESLILAQSERWRRGLGMQVERYRKV